MIVGDVRVLFVNVSVPANVARVPVVGSVTLVAAVEVSVRAKLPEVVKLFAVETLPPRVIVRPVLLTPVPPYCPAITPAFQVPVVTVPTVVRDAEPARGDAPIELCEIVRVAEPLYVEPEASPAPPLLNVIAARFPPRVTPEIVDAASLLTAIAAVPEMSLSTITPTPIDAPMLMSPEPSNDALPVRSPESEIVRAV